MYERCSKIIFFLLTLHANKEALQTEGFAEVITTVCYAYLHIYGPSHASWESKGVSSYRVLNITQNEQVKEEPPNCFQELLIVLPFSLIN